MAKKFRYPVDATAMTEAASKGLEPGSPILGLVRLVGRFFADRDRFLEDYLNTLPAASSGSGAWPGTTDDGFFTQTTAWGGVGGVYLEAYQDGFAGTRFGSLRVASTGVTITTPGGFTAASDDGMTLHVHNSTRRLLIESDLGDVYIQAPDATLGVLTLFTGNKITIASPKIGLYNVNGVVQPAAIAAPAGGGTIDTQARTAINSILAALGAAAGGIGVTA